MMLKISVKNGSRMSKLKSRMSKEKKTQMRAQIFASRNKNKPPRLIIKNELEN